MTNDFTQGFAAAVGAVARQFGRPGLAAEICRSYGLSVEDFERAGCDAFDLVEIRMALAERQD